MGIKIVEEVVKMYETSDGKKFSSEEWAKSHEDELEKSRLSRQWWDENVKHYEGCSDFIEDICDCHDGYSYLVTLRDGEMLDKYEAVFRNAFGIETEFYYFGETEGKHYLLMTSYDDSWAEWICLDSFMQDVQREVTQVLLWALPKLEGDSK